MAMGYFFISRFANIHNLYLKVQVFTGQRVVHIHINIKLADLDDRARLNPVIRINMDVFADRPRMCLRVRLCVCASVRLRLCVRV